MACQGNFQLGTNCLTLQSCCGSLRAEVSPVPQPRAQEGAGRLRRFHPIQKSSTIASISGVETMFPGCFSQKSLFPWHCRPQKLQTWVRNWCLPLQGRCSGQTDRIPDELTRSWTSKKSFAGRWPHSWACRQCPAHPNPAVPTALLCLHLKMGSI